MVDIVSRSKRSQMMSGIRGKNTKPELLIRKALHARGFRYRLHDPKLPGKPDVVFRKLNAVIFVNGCFWHGHDCHLFKWPKTRPQFWRTKITTNKAKDGKCHKALRDGGWRILTVWECALKGRGRIPDEEVIRICATWLSSVSPELTIEGRAGIRDK